MGFFEKFCNASANYLMLIASMPNGFSTVKICNDLSSCLWDVLFESMSFQFQFNRVVRGNMGKRGNMGYFCFSYFLTNMRPIFVHRCHFRSRQPLF